MLLPPDQHRLVDMRHYAAKALAFTDGLMDVAFPADELRLFPTIRGIEVIGEGATKVSKETREQHPKPPWVFMASMRHICIHEYGRVDPLRIWQSVRFSSPGLVAHLDRILAEPDSSL
jgi:uncharacterized protein with HEPN domain